MTTKKFYGICLCHFFKNKKGNYLTKNLINLRLACYHFLVQDFQQVLFFFGGVGGQNDHWQEGKFSLKTLWY